MTAGFHALGDNDVRSGSFGLDRFLDCRDSCEPLDARLLHPIDEFRRVETHDR